MKGWQEMNKVCKTISIVAACVLGLGLLLAGIGYVFGGANSVILEKTGFRVIDSTDKDEVDIVNETYTDVENIVVNVSYFSKIILREGDSFSVKGSNPKIQGGLESSLNAGTLSVSDSKKGSKFVMNLGFTNLFGIGPYSGYKQEALEITFPKGASLGKVEIISNMGDVEISDLKADRLEANLDLGDSSIDDVTCDTAIIDSDSGKVTIKNMECKSIDVILDLGACIINGLKTDEARIESDSGKVDITDIESNGTELSLSLGDLSVKGKLLGNSIIEMDSGSVMLDLRQSRDDTSYSIETDLGSVNINGNKSTGSVENRIPGAKNNLNINSDLGDVKVSFN